MEEDPYCCDSCWIKIVTASVICMVNACYQNSQFTLSFQPIYNLYLVQDGCDIDKINVWISNTNVSMAKPSYITHLNHVRVQMVNWYLLLVQVAVWVKKQFGALCCFWEGCVLSFCSFTAELKRFSFFLSSCRPFSGLKSSVLSEKIHQRVCILSIFNSMSLWLHGHLDYSWIKIQPFSVWLQRGLTPQRLLATRETSTQLGTAPSRPLNTPGSAWVTHTCTHTWWG